MCYYIRNTVPSHMAHLPEPGRRQPWLSDAVPLNTVTLVPCGHLDSPCHIQGNGKLHEVEILLVAANIVTGGRLQPVPI